MNKIFDKLAAAEDAFFSQEFFSPVIKGHGVRVRIAGVIVNLRITRPKNFEGWGVFRPTSFKTALLVREANMGERSEYLRLFPALRLVLCRHTDNQWYGVPFNSADNRFKIPGLAHVVFAEEVQMFEIIQVRFDGFVFWFEGLDEKSSPKTAEYLRESLAGLVDPDKLDCAGMTAGERDAYIMAYAPALEADIEAKRDKQEDRLRFAVEKAGGRFRSYIERGNTYTVEYLVDGQVQHSVVDRDTLRVQSAGICLAGGDRAFDLHSLVGVIREGQHRRLIHRTDGLMYNEYGYEENYGHGGDYDMY